MGLLWPDNTTESARSLLNSAVHAIRKALGDEVLTNQGNGLQLNSTKLRIDVVEFEASSRDAEFARALDLYTGPFLDGLALPGAVDFDHWLESERDRLERVYHTMLEQRAIEVARDAGPAEATSLWRRRLACTPADGRIVIHVMRNLAAAGDRAGALDVAAFHRRFLRDVLGLTPDPDVEIAAEQLRVPHPRQPAQAIGIGKRHASAEQMYNGDSADEDLTAYLGGIGPTTNASSEPARILEHSPNLRASVQDGYKHDPARSLWRRIRWANVRNRWFAMLGIIGALVVGWAGTRVWRSSEARWVENVALPQALRHLDEGDAMAAFRLLREARRHAPDHPLLEELLSMSTLPIQIRTIPEGAQVSVRDFADESDDWEVLGPSPLDVRLPESSSLVWRISADGYKSIVTVKRVTILAPPFELRPAAEAPADMVHVSGGQSVLELLSAHPLSLDPFWIDKYEVTNRQFRSFVESGGYERSDLWAEPVLENGVALHWEESRQRFRNPIGRSGPATWQVGDYPAGQDNQPVAGVSWYEAAAYCASVGKQLPTVHQWYQAADLAHVDPVVHQSNLNTNGPVDVGQPLALGGHGTYDMAGNVKEWVWNEDGVGRRYVLGGGWNEPIYQFRGYDARYPLERESIFGFRCVRNTRPAPPEQLGPVPAPFVDWRQVTPAPDTAFSFYRSLYEYDHTPLDSAVEPVRLESAFWTMERVSFAAAYGDERVPALLFLPKNATPPYQTIVYFPGMDAFSRTVAPQSVREEMGGGAYWLSAFLREGRAALVPVYYGSYHRSIGSPFLLNNWHEIVIHSAKDLRRAVDYLETRKDIDTARIAYFTVSSGVGLAPIMTAVEPRFKASVLLSGGLFAWRHRSPEIEAINFAPHVAVPTLLINGRFDFYYPYETSQVPLFEQLGVSAKRHRVLESGHLPLERSEIIKESLDWFDRYLGEAKR